jgi:putative aldouronate transport system substrate-binding protein
MKAKKTLAMMLVCAMAVSAFASCGSSSDTTTSTDSSSEAASSTAASSSDKEETSTPEVVTASDVVDGETDQQTYPIADGITLELWYPMASSMAELSDYNDSEFFQWYEEKTGIHINFTVPASGSEAESFQLLFASDSMPDMVYGYPAQSSYSYRSGQDKAIDDGYFVDIAEYLDVAPNYASWLANHDDLRQAAYSDTGKLYGMWGLWSGMDSERTYADYGLSIRQDYLDAVGLDVPTTYSEWETVLTAFKDQLGIAAPFYTSKYGIDTGEFMAGYDTAPYFYQRDGVVQYGPLDDQYKEYLTLLNDWYQKGLLDPDFATRSSTGVTADNDMILNDQVGALTDYGTRLDNTYVSRGASNENLVYVGAPQPTKDLDDPTYVEPAYRDNTYSSFLSGCCITISADSDYVEEAIRWCDGFYAEDVALNANYGCEDVEGTVWHYDDSTSTGRLIDYDYRYSNPDGMSSGMVLVKFSAKNPLIRYEGMQVECSTQIKQDGYDIWKTYEPVNTLPTRMTMTSDEGTESASIYTDIETYVQECNVKFIMGQMSLDDYDSYRDTLRSMGIERCIEIRQAALDRYNSRTY